MPRAVVALFASVILTVACAPPEPPASRVEALRSARDSFGVRMLYPTSGRTWTADFTRARTLEPGDSVGDLWNRGNGTLRIVGDGTAIASGNTQRHYIGDRSERRQWGSMELTYYARRLDDLTRDELLAGPSNAGVTAEVRTGDGHSSGGSAAQRCEGRAYGGSFRFYGHASFAKELQHPNYAPSSAADAAGGSVRRNVWPSGVPRNTWIGFKLVVYDRPGEVVLELYRDLSGGAGGGTWEQLIRYVDQPGRWGIPDTPTLCGMPTDRIISEPGPFVIVRNETTRVQYRDLTIREIEAAPVAGSAYVDIGDSIFVGAIRWLEGRGDLVPCNPPFNTWFCPDDALQRDEVAAFFARALDLSPPGGDRFRDDDTSPFEDDIEAIAECGISRGCNPPTNDRFCPDAPVTRGQMAAFFDRAFDLPRATRDHFTDDDGSIFEAAIDRLAAARITLGCNPPTNDRFCPDDPVTRGQLAAFLKRALESVPPTSACVCRASAEVCNALDDDCDGAVDENASAEVCGGGDDDCDGAIDENARPETCDGVDEDCDGAVDEDDHAESCNGIDDDCDGEVDEIACADGGAPPVDGGASDPDGGGTSASDGGVGERADAGRADASADPTVLSGGCGCRSTGARALPSLWLLGLLWPLVARRARRR
ncbi:MAG: S-layer homology domain-containing protein [Sandaracinaceae bacterium]